MSTLITRRNAIIAGLAGAGALALSRTPRQLPPTYGNLLRLGDNLTYAAHRILLPGQALVKEYTLADLTSFPAIGTTNPATSDNSLIAEDYHSLQQDGFRSWELSVEGSVANPRSFTIAQLKQLPSRTQITRHTCEEGWSAIGQWTGVPLSLVLDAVGILPSARFVAYSSIDDWVDSIDLLDALHPQTLLAYGMNGRDLPVAHGAPLRLRVETQLGAKSIKYLNRLVVLDEFDDGGLRGSIQNGWAWDMGI